ncbi:MAG TPA: beta-ketoacyl synthase N-terminal-like domain-containing protein [Tepidisphaeraceae bacterium]|nr:beta-ketoacyl synthase N-terminal-like domain-containing protein [Tepidisphaeraceae bacterium]
MTARRASILGVGAVTPLGRDLPAIQEQLERPAPASSGVLRVNDDFLPGPALSRRMRRADRFARMAAVAASDCWIGAPSACEGIARQRIGLIVSSGFGPHCRGFRFLDGILDCGDAEALPTDFSHSVHGAAAAYITEVLELRGPSLTTTDFEIGFEQAILLAQCWLEEGVCDRVLVGAVEEIGDVLIHCASRLLGKEGFVPGEGAVFLMLGPADDGGFAHLEATALPADLDLMMLDVPAIPSPAVQKPAAVARHTTTFSPYFGHTASSSAFQLLGGMLAIRAGRPLGRIIQSASTADASSVAVDKAATFKPSCDPLASSLLLTKR